MNSYEALRQLWAATPALVAVIPLNKLVAGQDETVPDYPYVIIETDSDDQESYTSLQRFDAEEIVLTAFDVNRKTVLTLQKVWRCVLTEAVWNLDGFISCDRTDGGNKKELKGIWSATDTLRVRYSTPRIRN